MADKILDYRGLKCPLPVLKARRALKDMNGGEILEIQADDPASPLDFAHFCEEAGHQLKSDVHVSPPFTFLITKAATSS